MVVNIEDFGTKTQLILLVLTALRARSIAKRSYHHGALCTAASGIPPWLFSSTPSKVPHSLALHSRGSNPIED